MSVETLQRLTTSNLKQLDILIQPDPGGRHEPNLDFNSAEVIAQPYDRISSPVESQKPQYQPVELAPGLVINPIPKLDMAMEMSRFFKDINAGLETGDTLDEAVRKSAQELEMNVRAYHAEITKSRPVLLHLNRFESVDGQIRMAGNNVKPIVDSISPKERRGSVLYASKEIEDSLVAAKENSFAVLMSPPGWHGFTDEFGREISPYRNAQSLVFWKDRKGQLKGLTFHLDLELGQAENVMSELGVSERVIEGKTEKDRIVDVVKNPALMSLPEEYSNPFDYVLDKILVARGNHAFRLIQEKGEPEIWPIEQIREDIRNFDQLLKGSLEEEGFIAELKDFILKHALQVKEKHIQQEIIYKVEKTILRLARQYLQDTGQLSIYQPTGIFEVSRQTYRGILTEGDDNFAVEIAYLKTRAGCPPGVSAMSLAGISLGSGGIGEVIGGSISGVIKDKDYCINCGACGALIKCVVRRGQKCPKCPAIRNC